MENIYIEPKSAIILNGKVIDIIEGYDGIIIPAGVDVKMDDLYENGKFIPVGRKKLLQKAKDAKCKEIDASTKEKILALIGNETKQRNLTAKSTQLVLKEFRGTITDGETKILSGLDSKFKTVEQLIIAGNALELLVQSKGTIKEVQNIC